MGPVVAAHFFDGAGGMGRLVVKRFCSLVWCSVHVRFPWFLVMVLSGPCLFLSRSSAAAFFVSASNLAPLNHIGACFHLSSRKKLQHLLHFCCFPCFSSRHSTTTVLWSEHVRAADRFFVAHFVVAVPTLLSVLWFLVVMGRCSGGMIRLEVVRLRQRQRW